MQLKITRALPNPPGKDRTKNFIPKEQLNHEWVEFVNTTNTPLNLGGVSVSHETFRGLERTGTEELDSFLGHVVIQPGQTFRLHTGRGLVYTDSLGVHHSYLNRDNYVWNNDAGDRITLRDRLGNVIDSAWYYPFPPEGIILLRVAA